MCESRTSINRDEPDFDFIEHIGPAVEDWWADLGSPHLTPEITEQLIEGVTAEADGRSMTELAQQCDALLVAVLEALNRTRAELGQ